MIKVENLVKVFGKFRAVDGISFEVSRGEIFALLGPNGAGKTTTIRILTTLSRPTSGTAYINGYDVRSQSLEVKKQIGVVPQQLNLEKELSAWENLELNGMLYGMEKEERRRRIEELLDYVGLMDKANVNVDKFSGGMMRRLMIARALMHRPRVLFLDEPTVGLDPQTRRKIWDLIKTMNQSGMTVLLTTHYIEEAEKLCHRVAIIDKGKLIAIGSPDELKKQTGNVVLEYLENDTTVRRFFSSRTEALEYAQSLDTDINIRESNLEDVFVKITGGEICENKPL
ncbi:ABC transporter ATP-binding protein [Thermoanaerobacter kivui]